MGKKQKEPDPICGDCVHFLWDKFFCGWQFPCPVPSWLEGETAIARNRSPEHTAVGCQPFAKRAIKAVG